MSLAKWYIKQLAEQGMISPFEPDKVQCNGILSYGCESSGYTFRLGHTFRLLIPRRQRDRGVIDPKKFDDSYLTFPIHTTDGEVFPLPPGGKALAHSLEHFNMPNDVEGIGQLKSIYERCFLQFPDCPLQAGWKGQLVLEIYNPTDRVVNLYPGEGFARVVFFHVENAEPEGYEGQYQDQEGIVIA